MSAMRGPYHRALQTLLEQARKAGKLTQESLAEDVEKEQTTVGKYLRDKAGTLDLDEADAALRHVGSNLRAFINDPARVHPSNDPPVLVQRLMRHAEFVQFCEAVAALREPQRQRALASYAALAQASRPRQSGGSAGGGEGTNNRTKSVIKKHR